MANPIFSFARVTYAPIGKANFIPFESDLEQRVLNITVSMSEGDLPVINLTLRNTDLSLFDHVIISKFTQVTIRLIRENEESPRIVGIVQKVSGNWFLNIEITDLVFQGHLKPDDSDIQTDGKSRKDVIIELFKKLGFEDTVIDVEASEEKKAEGTKFDTTKTIWQNIQDQAKEERAKVILIGREKVLFKKRDFSRDPVEIVTIEPFGGPEETEVKDWNITNDLLDKRGQVIMKGINLLTKKEIEVKKDRSSTPRPGLGNLTELFEPGAKADIDKTEGERTGVEIVVDENRGTRSIEFATPEKTGSSETVRTSAQSEAAATNEAEGDFKESEDRQVMMTLVTRLRPGRVPGSIIQVNGLGKTYSGKWYITKVKHEVPGTAAQTVSELIRNLLPSVPSEVKVDSGKADTNKKPVRDPDKLEEKTSIEIDPDTGKRTVTYGKNR